MYCQLKLERNEGSRKQLFQNNRVSNSNLLKCYSFICNKYKTFQLMDHWVGSAVGTTAKRCSGTLGNDGYLLKLQVLLSKKIKVCFAKCLIQIHRQPKPKSQEFNVSERKMFPYTSPQGINSDLRIENTDPINPILQRPKRNCIGF